MKVATIIEEKEEENDKLSNLSALKAIKVKNTTFTFLLFQEQRKHHSSLRESERFNLSAGKQSFGFISLYE